MKRIEKLLWLGLVVFVLWGCNGKPTERPFITKWKGTAGKELRIPILGTYTLTWYNEATPNERHSEQVTVTSFKGNWFEETAAYRFTPPTDGVYVVEAGPEGVEGMLMSFGFDDARHFGPNLLSVVQFGDVVWKKLYRAFDFCSNMCFEEGIDTPNLSQCTDLEQMFRGCKVFNSPLSQWDVSKITDMRGMFEDCESFNQPLGSWDVSHVTDMSSMFNNCIAFNQFLEPWDVSQVTDMHGMFSGCKTFNQPLNRWNVEKVTDMSLMFFYCSSFNQSLEAWKINPIAQSNGLRGMFDSSPTAELPFVAKWRAAGYQLDQIIEEEFIPEEEEYEEAMEEQ